MLIMASVIVGKRFMFTLQYFKSHQNMKIALNWWYIGLLMNNAEKNVYFSSKRKLFGKSKIEMLVIWYFNN